VWLFDVNRRILSQLTHTQGVSFDAVWLPDSRSVIFSNETPMYDLHRARIDGTAPDTVLADGFDKLASSVSPDGRTLAYSERSHPARLLFMPVAGGKATLLEVSESDQMNGAFSPDGHWLAYDEVNPNGHSEVYVRGLEGPAGRRQVSADGGSQPRWVRGGKEIIYRKGDAVLSVSFDQASGDVGTPALLFRKPDAGRLGGSTIGYDAAPDGSRFLLVVPVEQPGARATTVVLHWLDRLGRDRP
jgi:Tol biopolymer transport system component